MSTPLPMNGASRAALAPLLRDLSPAALLRTAEAMAEALGAERAEKIVASTKFTGSTDVSIDSASMTDLPSLSSTPAFPAEEGATSSLRRALQRPRTFDMSEHAQRKVALWVAYFGDKYQGFASNGVDDGSVENVFFAALEKTKLVDASLGRGGEAWDYSRCGRTDAGVSALTQVVALKLRSKGEHLNKKQEEGQASDAAGPDYASEYDYCNMLNRVLPEDIMVLAWAPVPTENFNARFACKSRTYRYYFTIRPEMDLEYMREGAARLVGSHDFRNFCRMDVENAVSFERVVHSCKVVVPEQETSLWRLGYVEIRGTAFLWHQVRYMMSVLFLVAQRLETPDVVSKLLDPSIVARRPTMKLASELPLVLFANEYDLQLDWQVSPHSIQCVYERLERRLHRLSITTQMTRTVLESLREPPFSNERTRISSDFDEANLKKGPPGWGQRRYFPLLTRKGGMTVEEKINSLPQAKREKVLEKRERTAIFMANLEKSTSGVSQTPDGDEGE